MTAIRRMTVMALTAATVVSFFGVVPTSWAAQQQPTSPPVSLGLAPQVHGAAKAETRPLSTRSKGVRHRLSSGAARSKTAPAATGSTSTSTGALLHNFNGVSSRDSEVTNFNARFEPPDQGLCAGNGFVLEPVNSAYSIYRTNGARVRGPFNVNDLFNEGAAEFTSDPRCYYDATTHRWFATILFLNAAFTSGRIDIATSQTADPTGPWSHFQINTTHKGGNGCPCFGDQPRLGIDRNNLYVTTDEFSINGPEFNGAQIYAIDKNDLVNARASAHFVHFGPLSSGGTLAFSVQPALTTGSSSAEYFLNSLDPTGAGDHRIGVWALTHGDRVGRGGTPVLTSKVIASEPYVVPEPSPQKGSSTQIDSGDDRMQQTQYINGRIWGELTTGLTPPGATTPRAGAAWFAVRPTLGNDRLTGASVVRQGYVTAPGASVIYPALQADSAGRAAMVFTLTGATRFPSAAYATLPATGSSFGSVKVTATGSGSYVSDSPRWGDYSFAVLSPTSDAVWLATEYVPPRSSQTSTRERNWGTRVFEVGLH
jgi:hypothetical protein